MRQYPVDSMVEIAEEYRNHAKLNGSYKGVIGRVNLVGTVLVYTVCLDSGTQIDITHSALRAAS